MVIDENGHLIIDSDHNWLDFDIENFRETSIHITKGIWELKDKDKVEKYQNAMNSAIDDWLEVDWSTCGRKDYQK